MKIEKVHTKPHYYHGTKCLDSGLYGQSLCRNIVYKLLNIKLLPPLLNMFFISRTSLNT